MWSLVCVEINRGESYTRWDANLSDALSPSRLVPSHASTMPSPYLIQVLQHFLLLVGSGCGGSDFELQVRIRPISHGESTSLS